MKVYLALKVARLLYCGGGRELILHFVRKSENPYDDGAVKALDAFFECGDTFKKTNDV